MNILFIGDIIGGPGRENVSSVLQTLKKKYSINFTVANGENSAGGIGISKKAADEIFSSGVDVITLGNHSFDRKEYVEVIDYPYIIRPANYSSYAPGKGYCVMNNVAVLNLMGRFNMPLVDCPFRTADKVLESLSRTNPKISIIIVDFHAELTAEKEAMGYYLDGRVSAVIGTHTHVQTADEKILQSGTGYITDVGMVGAKDSVIGVDKAEVIKRFLTGMPARFQVSRDNILLNSVIIKIDDVTGKCSKIERVNQ